MAADKYEQRDEEGIGNRPNTLNVNQRTLIALADMLDGGSKMPATKKRDFARWPFRLATLNVLIHQDRNNRLPLKLACRNLSRGGISLLHAAYVHHGTRLTVNLPSLHGGEVAISGSVVRCIHRGGVVHEIGVKFDSHIDIRRFATPAVDSNGFSLERIDGAKLTGRVLLVSDSPSDIRLYEHFLSATGAEIVGVVGGEAALEITRKDGFDAIVCDEDVRCTLVSDGQETTVVPFAQAARADGCASHFIVLALSRTSQTVQQIQKLSGVLVVLKPVSQDHLMIAMGEFLTGASPNVSGALCSTIPTIDPAAHLVVSYVRELRDLAGKLDQGLRRDDAEVCTKICRRIQGSAAPMGFAVLGELAEKAAKTISTSRSLGTSQRIVKELIIACERARAAA